MRHSFFTRISAALIALVLLLALFPSASAATSQFTDLSRAAYPAYFDAINFVVDNGYMNGMSTTKFEPNTNLTRAMFITLLYRYDGSPTPIGSMPFEDVSSSAYYYDAVRWGANEGIVTGMTDTLFNPNASVTREQVMTFLYRYSFSYRYDLVENIYASIIGKTDYSSVSEYARTPMQWAVSNGLTTTVGNQSYLYPKTVAQRKEVALWLCLYDQNVVGLEDGKEIYSFYNTNTDFNSGRCNRTLISTDHWEKLCSYAATPKELDLLTARLNMPWGGSCFGMTATCLLDQTGQIAFNEVFVDDCPDMYSVPRPINIYSPDHTTVSAHGYSGETITIAESAINYYQLSQMLSCIDSGKYSYAWVSGSTAQSALSSIVQNQQDGGVLLLGIGTTAVSPPSPDHAILLFGRAEYSQAVSGVYYIDAYDPNIGMTNVRISLQDNRVQLFRNGAYVDIYSVIYWNDYSVFNTIDIDGNYNNSTSSVASTDNTQTTAFTTWLYMNPDVPATITNAEGETLTLHQGMPSGTMEVLGYVPIFSGLGTSRLWKYQVKASESFTYTRQDDSLDYTEFTVCGPTLFGGAYGTGIEKVVASSQGTQIDGTGMDVTCYTASGCPDEYYLSAVVHGDSHFVLSSSQAEDAVSATVTVGVATVSIISNKTAMAVAEYLVTPTESQELFSTWDDVDLTTDVSYNTIDTTSSEIVIPTPQPSDSAITLYINPDIPAVVINAEGQVLKIRQGKTSGTLEVLGSTPILAGLAPARQWAYQVEASESFTYIRQDGALDYTEFTVCGPDLYGSAYGTGIQMVHVSHQGVQVEGKEMDITACTASGCPDEYYFRSVISGESHFGLMSPLENGGASATTTEGAATVYIISNKTAMPVAEFAMPSPQTKVLFSTWEDLNLISVN